MKHSTGETHKQITMDHATAVQEYAVERYVLGELSLSEQEAFEEHFFACMVCSESLRDAEALVLGVKRIGEEAPPPAPKPPQLFRLPAFVQAPAFSLALMLALGAETAYLALNGRPDAPREVATYVLRPASRGEANYVSASKDAAVVLMLDLPPDTKGPVRILLQPSSREPISSVPVDGAVSIYLPPGRLAPGKYSLIVQSQAGVTISNYPLTVRE